MRTVTAVEARHHLGELLNIVSLKREDVIIERSGRRIAKLTPCDASTTSHQSAGRQDFRRAAGLGKDFWNKVDIGRHIESEREKWDS